MQVNSSVFSSQSITYPATYVPGTAIYDSDILTVTRIFLSNLTLISKLTARVYELLLVALQERQKRLNN